MCRYASAAKISHSLPRPLVLPHPSLLPPPCVLFQIMVGSLTALPFLASFPSLEQDDVSQINALADMVDAEAARLASECNIPDLVPLGGLPPAGSARLSERIEGVRAVLQRLIEELLIADAEKRWGGGRGRAGWSSDGPRSPLLVLQQCANAASPQAPHPSALPCLGRPLSCLLGAEAFALKPKAACWSPA